MAQYEEGLLHIPGPEVPGAEMVTELPSPVALLVWSAYRRLLVWCDEPPAARATLFELDGMADEAAALARMRMDEALRDPLVLITANLALPEPDPEEMALACLAVTDWALARRATATALDFAAMAAKVWPTSPRYALVAGRLYREHGHPRDAEMWLERALKLSVTFQDHEAKTRTLDALGNLRVAEGSYPDAAELFRRALRSAQRHRLHSQVGEAWHSLFVVAVATRDLSAASRYSQEALASYRAGHPRLPHFAHDLAWFWMEQGDFRNALDILESLCRTYFLDESASRIVVVANAARAAGACGNSDLFRLSQAEVDLLAAELDRSLRVAPALLETARGLANLGLMEECGVLLDRVLDSARRTGQHDTVFRAEELLNAIRRREHTNEVATPAGGRPGNRVLAQTAVATLDAASALSISATEGVGTPRGGGVAGSRRRRGFRGGGPVGG